MLVDVHLRAVRNHFDLLSAGGDGRSACQNAILRGFGWFFSSPITVSFFGHFPLQFRLLHLIRCLAGSLLGRISGGVRGVVMKTLLNVFGQLDKINFRDSRFSFQHNAIRFNPANSRIFVFSPVDRLEVVGTCG